MTGIAISAPYEVFADIDGQPLENGFIWIGEANLDPQVNPINVYWDEALTIPAAQPLRTLGGYVINSGTPARVYIAESGYSMRVQNRNGSTLFTVPEGNLIDPNATGISFVQTGTGAVTRTVAAKLHEYVSVLDYGADPTGATNSIRAFNFAMRSGKSVYIPRGTYLIEPDTTPGTPFGDFMIYIGSSGSDPLLQTNLNGLTVFGDGNESIIKLGDNVGRNKLLFGAGVGDSLASMTFRDFAINFNGANNLQTSFSDPLRYNSGFYFFCPCNNMRFENLYMYNFSGSQAIRVGNDTSNYGANIKILNCRVNNFGIGLPGNFQQDVSVFYVQADGIEIDSCWFQNSDFTFDLSRGQTALELHGANSTIVTNNRFSFTQMPVLIVSAANPNSNILVDNNVFIQTAYMVGLDPAELDQKRITISNNIYQSTKMSGSGIIPIGMSAEPAKTREEVMIIGNTINCFGNTNERVNLIYVDNAALRSIVIEDNIVSGLPGNLVYFSGPVIDDTYCDIVIKNNRLDSLGNVGGSTFPTAPSFVFVVPTSGTMNALTIDGNQLFNTAGKNYSAFGLFRVGGNINYLTIENNDVSAVSAAYPVTTEFGLVSLIRLIQAGYYMPVDYRTGAVTVAGSGGVVNLYNFSSGAGWGNNDNALLTAQLWIGIGGTTNNTVQFLNIGWLSSGGNVTTDSNFGSFAADVSVSFSGTTLRITNNNANALSLYWNVQGLATKPITWLI
jgi:hypothetical protein